MKCGWIILMVMFLSFSCSKDSSDQLKIDREKIEAYLTQYNLQAEHNDDGLYYIIHDEGTGEEYPTVSSTVKIRYTGYLLDGFIFDSTEGKDPLNIALYNTVRGWQQGIPLLKKNGKAKLIIPSHLGYGSQAFGPIPKNSVLIFDVELLGFF